jgi:hypothetical protein
MSATVVVRGRDLKWLSTVCDFTVEPAALYRVTVEKHRGQPPAGYRWDGDTLVGYDEIFYVSVVGGRVEGRSYGSRVGVPRVVFETFVREGML